MTQPSSFKQNDVRKALVAAKRAGLQPRACRITPMGDIVLNFSEGGQSSSNSFDALIGKSHD